MRYICNSLVKRVRSAHNTHKFVSLFSHHLKLCNHLKKEKEVSEMEGAAFPTKLGSFMCVKYSMFVLMVLQYGIILQ